VTDEKQPHRDPLIDEVRQRRRELSARYDNDLQKLYEAIKRRQDEHPEKVVDPPRERVREP
jgi:hypothetical protein